MEALFLNGHLFLFIKDVMAYYRCITKREQNRTNNKLFRLSRANKLDT